MTWHNFTTYKPPKGYFVFKWQDRTVLANCLGEGQYDIYRPVNTPITVDDIKEWRTTSYTKEGFLNYE